MKKINKVEPTNSEMNNNLNAAIENEIAVENWYNALQCKSILDEFTVNDLAIKKSKQWLLIKNQINEHENSQPNGHVNGDIKSLFYYVSRVAAVLTLVALSYYSYLLISQKPVITAQYVILTNNTKHATKILLADNSLLFLKPNSSIKCPKKFNRERRVFLLTGSVFFSITHNPQKPFIVETGNGINTKVLGTAFVIEKVVNNTLKVSVLRGKVQVSDNTKKYAILTKNQAVKLDTKAKRLFNIKADSLQMTSWFNSKVVLENVTLKDVAASVNKNLGYKMVFSTATLLSKPCTITYNTADNIESILLLLDKIYQTTHAFSNDGTIIIKPVQL